MLPNGLEINLPIPDQGTLAHFSRISFLLIRLFEYIRRKEKVLHICLIAKALKFCHNDPVIAVLLPECRCLDLNCRIGGEIFLAQKPYKEKLPLDMRKAGNTKI